MNPCRMCQPRRKTAKCKVTTQWQLVKFKYFLFSPRVAVQLPGTFQNQGHLCASLSSKSEPVREASSKILRPGAAPVVRRPTRSLAGDPAMALALNLAVYAAHAIFVLPHTVEQRVALVPNEVFASVAPLPRELPGSNIMSCIHGLHLHFLDRR